MHAKKEMTRESGSFLFYSYHICVSAMHFL